MEFFDFLLGLISGAILIMVSQIVGYYLTKKNVKAQQEHALRVAKMQLFHDDTKEALVKLDELLKTHYRKFDDFRNSVNSFLNGSESVFIPIKLRDDLKRQVQDIDQYLMEKLYGDVPIEEEDDYEAWAEDYPEQALDVEIRDRMSGLRESMRDRIRKYLSEE